MNFDTPLIRATLLKRYKRFLADVQLESGEIVTAHCANPGAMTGLKDEGLKVWLEPNDDPKRKLNYSWKLVELAGDQFAGIDTAIPNRVIKEALAAGQIEPMRAYSTIRPEVKYGKNSRVDFLLTDPALPDCYLEVKNVHLMRQPGLAEFPDSVTKRGTKHLEELATMAKAGYRSVMLFLVQHTGCTEFTLAADIDPAYAAAYTAARSLGVEALCYSTEITPEGISLGAPMPIVYPL